MERIAPAVPSSRSAIDSGYNGIFLRRDVHLLWDRHHFYHRPEVGCREQLTPTIHVTNVTSNDIAKNHHNHQPHQTCGVRPEYPFARFAWNIFPYLKAFHNANALRTLAVFDTQTDMGDFTPSDCKEPAKCQGSRSCSRSPSKEDYPRRKRRDANKTDVASGSPPNSVNSGIAGFSSSARKRARLDHHMDELFDADSSEVDIEIERDHFLQSSSSSSSLRHS